MGTHPIFESDFDCLTEGVNRNFRVMSVLVYGGQGALGRCLVNRLKSKYKIISVDLHENAAAHLNIIACGKTLDEQYESIEAKLIESEGENRSLNAVICVAGGFSGGSVNAKSFLKSVSSSIEQSIWTSTIASRLAHKYMDTNGILVLTGSAGALEPGPKSVGYSMAKAAVHSMTKSLADEDSPFSGDIVTILPTTIDTEMNRNWMKDADFS